MEQTVLTTFEVIATRTVPDLVTPSTRLPPVRRFFLRGFLLVGALLGVPEVCAQPIPEGPGLDAVRDTLIVDEGQTRVRLAPDLTPESVEVHVLRGVAWFPTNDFEVDHKEGILTLGETITTPGRLAVAYRILPGGIDPLLVDLPVVKQDSVGGMRVTSSDSLAESRPEQPSRIESSGSISRGIVAGNNRDVSVTSGLRLHVEGELADDVFVRARLTDHDTPLLPEGTTQEISDLDRILLEIDAPLGKASLGDLDLGMGGTRFAPLDRRVQGIGLSTQFGSSGALESGTVQVAGSVARGRYHSLEIIPEAGVQGPYRLTGANGEPFVIVIPRSERVSLDGRLLERGENADYTIDYATGEITFTLRHLITAERRITVDYEYSDGSAGQSLLAADVNTRWRLASNRKATLGVRVLREADTAVFGESIGLSEEERLALEQAGDRPVFVDGSERVPFEPESSFVQYAKRDTVLAGEATQYFVPATADAEEVYRVRFTRVASGEGSYRRGAQHRNGIVYEFVGPSGGDYVPFRRLRAPSARNVLDVHGSAEILPGLRLRGEWAASQDDANTFSSIGDADDQGGAYEAALEIDSVSVGGMGALSGQISRRRRSPRFRTLDRIRDIEFEREWNLARSGTAASAALDTLGESLWEGKLRWNLPDRAAVAVEAGRLAIRDLRANRLAANVVATPLSGITGRYEMNWSTTETGPVLQPLVGQGSFLEGLASVETSWLEDHLQAAVAFEHERREQDVAPVNLDTVRTDSYGFRAVRPSISWSARTLDTGLSLEWRAEDAPLDPRNNPSDLQTSAHAFSVEANADWRPSNSLRSNVRLTLRNTDPTEVFRQRGRLGGQAVAVEWATQATPGPAGAVRLNTLYRASTDRSPVLQETYVEVGSDFGTHIWRDGEGEARPGEPDGVAQIDEFFPETSPLEGTFVRTFVPSDDYLSTVGVRGRLNLRLSPARLFDATWLRLFSLRSTVDVEEKSTSDAVLKVLLFYPTRLQKPGTPARPATLNGRFRMEHELLLFPGENTYGISLLGRHTTSTSRLAAGLDRRLSQQLEANAYATWNRAFTLRMEAGMSRERAENESFFTRSYDLNGWHIEPELSWSPSTSTRLSLSAYLSDRTDDLAVAGRPEGAFLLRFPLDARMTFSERLSASSRIEVSSVSLRGDNAGGFALFELTDGRGPGLSALWNARVNVGLTSLIRASLVYDGRAPAEAPVIHTARIELKASF